MGELIIAQDIELRVLVTAICQLRCVFFHNEGQAGEQNTWRKRKLADVSQVSHFRLELVEEVLLPLKNRLNVAQIHLTGGEPTLNPFLVEIVERCRAHFKSVKMTTNGIFPPNFLEKLQGSFSLIVFSLHSTSWEKFHYIQGVHLNCRQAKMYSQQQQENIRLAIDRGIPVKINSVVLEKETTLENIEFAQKLGVEIRLLKDLTNPRLSSQIVQDIIRKGGFRLEQTQVGTADSSAYREVYSNGITRFTVKRFQEIYLNEMCYHCQIIDQCKEYFYGIRVESDGKVRLCMQRDDLMTLMSVNDFLSISPLCNAVEKAYFH
ncbi:MAG: radical SAM protein [Patescibacteria group bacterium]|nr:radical SAM protein [Patescibacteria group bacterium]